MSNRSARRRRHNTTSNVGRFRVDFDEPLFRLLRDVDDEDEQRAKAPRGRTFGRRTAFFMVRQPDPTPPAPKVTFDRKRGIVTIDSGAA